MNQYDNNHYRFQRYPDRRSWAGRPDTEPKWVPWVGGFVAGCFFAFMFYLGV